MLLPSDDNYCSIILNAINITYSTEDYSLHY